MNDELQTQKIYEAIKKGHVSELQVLLSSNGSHLEAKTPFGTWLHVAASFGGNLDIVKCLVEMGISVNEKGGVLGGTPLNVAVSRGHIKVVNYLLQCATEIDVSVPERNPLFGAIYGGHKDIVEILIEHGIDTQIRYTGECMSNMDAVAFAQERGHTEIAELILASLNQNQH
jgi:uncharacterized protein